MLESHIAQLASSSASRPYGPLPSQPMQPRETTNAINLRSGVQYDASMMLEVESSVAQKPQEVPEDIEAREKQGAINKTIEVTK